MTFAASYLINGFNRGAESLRCRAAMQRHGRSARRQTTAPSAICRRISCCSRNREGEVFRSRRKLIPWPPPVWALRESASRKSIAFCGWTFVPAQVNRRERSGSYRFRIEACAHRSVPPLPPGYSGFAFHFNRTSFVRPRHQWNGPAARRHRRRINSATPIHVILRLLAKRLQVFHRPAASAPGQPSPARKKRGGHDLHEMPARNRIRPLAGSLRKFPAQPLPEFGRIGHFIQAPPIPPADGQI